MSFVLVFLIFLHWVTFSEKTDLLFCFMWVRSYRLWTFMTVFPLLLTSSIVATEEWCWPPTVFYKIGGKIKKFREHRQMHFFACAKKENKQKKCLLQKIMKKKFLVAWTNVLLWLTELCFLIDLAHSALISVSCREN